MTTISNIIYLISYLLYAHMHFLKCIPLVMIITLGMLIHAISLSGLLNIPQYRHNMINYSPIAKYIVFLIFHYYDYYSNEHSCTSILYIPLSTTLNENLEVEFS